MKIVFCPNPACPRGIIWTGLGRPSRPVGKCPDCGRTSRLERTAPVATLGSPADLELLEAIENRMEREAAREALSAPGRRSWDEAGAELALQDDGAASTAQGKGSA